MLVYHAVVLECVLALAREQSGTVALYDTKRKESLSKRGNLDNYL